MSNSPLESGPVRAGRSPADRDGRRRSPAPVRALVFMTVALVALTGCDEPKAQTSASWQTAPTTAATSPAPSTPTATATPPPPTSPAGALPPELLARIPRFPAPPPPEPVTLPGGPAAPWITHIETTKPIAFLTIDDGKFKEPLAEELLRAANIPVTLFLDMTSIRDNPGYFIKLQAVGATIEAHTLTHQNLKGKSYDVQRTEICGSADQLGALYGRRPVLFRPPYGEKDNTTLKAVRDCGLKAAFFWKETVNNGALQYQTSFHQVRPGDIILMHFRTGFIDDFLAALQAMHDAGLTPARLEDYIP